MYRAIMESIAYEYALYLRSVRALAPDLAYDDALNIGGGARSAVFRQIKADVLGLDYRCLDRDEFGTLGSAIVAGHAVGLFGDMAATASSWSSPREGRIIPHGATRDAYAPYVALYARLLEETEGIFTGLGDVRDRRALMA
jgi:xylulokinase